MDDQIINDELNMVFRYLIGKGISHADAEDAVQETAYKYYNFSDTIRSSKVRSWLIRVALNYYYDQCRKRNRYILNTEEQINSQEGGESPESIILHKENKDELNRQLSKLKPFYTELLLLKYESELSYAEISQLLDISTSSVKTNLFRARKKLLKLYKEENNEQS